MIVHKKTDASRNMSVNGERTLPQPHRNVGVCLNCGETLTRCGAAFDLEVTCPVCGRVNVYKDSNKPIYIK